MTTTPVPACTDDLLAEIERVTDPDAIHMIAHSDMEALLARLHAAEKDAGLYKGLAEFANQNARDAARCLSGERPGVAATFVSFADKIDAAMEASK